MAVHRRRATALLLLALVAASFVVGVVRAQDAEDVDETEDVEPAAAAPAAAPRSHPLTNMPPAAPGVETKYVFTKHPGDLPIGEEIAVLCAFTNKGSSAMNVTHVMGSINSPYNFNIYVANFTARAVGTLVEPNEEVSVVYGILANPLVVDPFEYRLAFTAFYNDGTHGFSTTFFNETRQFYETSQPWTFKAAFPYMVGVAALAGAAYFFKGGKAKTSAFDVEDDDWNTTGVNAPTSKKGSKKGPKASKKGSKKSN